MLAAVDSGNFRQVSYYANELAYIAIKDGEDDQYFPYSTLAFDAGFRALGLDPTNDENPLIYADPKQENRMVLSPAGRHVLEAYNESLGLKDKELIKQWNSVTARSLRDVKPPAVSDTGNIGSQLQVIPTDFNPRQIRFEDGRAMLAPRAQP